MRIKKSQMVNGYIGFYTKDEDGHSEEFLSVKTTDKAQRIINQLQKDITKLR